MSKLRGLISSFIDYPPPLVRLLWHWPWRIAGYAAVVGGVFFILLVLSLQYWFFPRIGEYREYLAASVSKAAGQRVAIGAIAASWDGLRPHLDLQQIQVYDQRQRPALYLARIEGSLSWLSLMVGEVRLHSLSIDEPILTVRREANGLVYIAGVPLNQPDAQSGFADWILRQRHIRVRNAVIQWLDGMRQAPSLVLSSVNLRLENEGRRHRFGLRAVPPASLAQPLDIRGDLEGASVQDFSGWRGTLYARLDNTDIAAWRSWVPFPFELERGFGGVRAWLAFGGGKRLEEITADVRLSGVKTRLAANLPQLELNSMSGRISWRNLMPGFEISFSKVGLAARDGLVLPTADISLRMVPGIDKKPAHGEFKADGLSLEPVVTLANYLPLEGEAVQLLAQIYPRGSFRDFDIKWSGEWNAPLAYHARGQFANLGMNPYTLPANGLKLPGFSGLSGTLDANEKKGALSFNSTSTGVEFPEIFPEPLALETLTGQLSWVVKNNRPEFKLNNISFANAHLAGSVYGSYRVVSGAPGYINLTGQFTRADARQAGRYIPLKIGASTRQWIASSVIAGQSNDVRLRLVGNLADFPFADGKRGLFQVNAKVFNGTLEYAHGWPRMENISVDLLFQGKRMEVTSQQAGIYGAKLAKIHAVIPDLLHHDEMLEITGEARGATQDFLRFVGSSPVSGMIEGFTEGMQASGQGVLTMRLDIPLRRSKESLVQGSYQLLDNRIIADPDLPELEQLNGHLSFTEKSVGAQLTATILGGPAILSAVPQQDGAVRVGMHGRITAAGLRKFSSQPLLQHASGATNWEGVLLLRKKQTDAVIESELRGLALDLPAPFNKREADVLPLKFEKKTTGVRSDSLSFTLGKVVAAQLQRRLDGRRATVERGVINLGGAIAAPAERGVWLVGELRFLDMDQWRRLLAGSGAKPMFELAGINLNLATADVFDRRFSNLKINARHQADIWRASLSGREISGDLSWNPAGRGKLGARLKNLSLPAAVPGKAEARVELPREMPELDIVADNLEIRQKKLGKLELQAIPEGGDLRLKKVRLIVPEGSVQLSGVWQDWLRQSQTRVNVQMEARDIGKLLARMGYPDSVRRGEVRLDGKLAWTGAPYAIDFPSMSGELALEAHRGQFVKIDPGIGKLLGVLSLQSLPRRITLDFRDVFSEGFAFDDISSSIRITKGVLSSNNFSMQGPAARVSMSGEADLVHETQNLRVRVIPMLGESVSVAGALLGGPVVGLAALLAQKVLKDPLGRIVSYEYIISGTWDNPTVSKVE